MAESVSGILDRVFYRFVKAEALRVTDKNKKSVLIIGKEFNFRAGKYAKLLAGDKRFQIILACHRSSNLDPELSGGSFKIACFYFATGKAKCAAIAGDKIAY